LSRLSKDDDVTLGVQDDPTPGRQLLTFHERRRNIRFLTITAFFASSASSVHFIFYSLYFRAINDSEKLFGIIGTISACVAIIGLIVADYLNGLLGYKRVYIIAQILVAISFTFFLFDEYNKIGLVITAVMILSFAFSLNESPYNIILTETAGEDKKGAISALTSFFGRFGEVIVSAIVFIVTFVLGIEYTNNERAYFYLYGAIVVALITIGIIFLVTDPSRKYKEQLKANESIEIPDKPLEENIEEPKVAQEKKIGFLRGFVETFKDKWVLRVALTFFIEAFLWTIALGVHWPGLQDEDLFGIYALSDKTTSLLIMVTSLTILVTMYFGKYVDKVGAKLFLFISELCGLAWITLSVAYTFRPQFLWIMIIARIFLGASIALWIPSTIALFTNVEPERKSKVYNSLAIFRSIGWMPGGFIAGFLYDSIPQPYGFLTPMFILIGGMIIIIPLIYTLPNKPSDMINRKSKSKNKKSS
jgi:MFS family permease